MKVKVSDNPNTGPCSAVDHWKEVLENDNEFLGCEVQYDENSKEDSVVIYGDSDKELARFDDSMAIRMDIIGKDLQDLKGGTISWEDLIKKYGK